MSEPETTTDAATDGAPVSPGALGLSSSDLAFYDWWQGDGASSVPESLFNRPLAKAAWDAALKWLAHGAETGDERR